MKCVTVALFIVLTTCQLYGQEKSVSNFKKENLNWFNKDIEIDKVLGASVDRTYDSILPNLKVKDTIIVAVIDGGVDINHEDLVGKIWINTKEIPNNGFDDDGNGFIDDINGWNFIGNKLGQNLHYENYEYTRLLKDSKYDSILVKAKILYDSELQRRRQDSVSIYTFEINYKKAKSVILKKTGVDVKSLKDLSKVNSYTDQDVIDAKYFLQSKFEMGFTEKDLERRKSRNIEFLKYFLNQNFNPRGLIGDDPYNIEDKNYGNNDVKGPRSDHGTSVAGVISAIRNNSVGINGVASNVKIMPLRVIPRGDERDKDISLAIIYAVDNGARIINMSFGRKISSNKEFVDDAVKYAEKQNVLIIHSSGNDGLDLDKNESFPSGNYLDGNKASNWMNVGASGMYLDKFLPANFSNYGKKNVDVFAPGIDIISLDSSNLYSMKDGTSISAPIVTGVSALLLSYFPELSPIELINILLEGSYKAIKPKRVIIPNSIDSKKKAEFITLSKSGGIVNTYNSFMIAIKKQKL